MKPGERLGPYVIVSPLGKGGMGEVWKARDHRLERHVAVKVLAQPLVHDPDALARFEREARAVAALNHPAILGIHDFSQEGSEAYAVMELLEGESLRTRLEDGPLPLRRSLELAIEVAHGLSAAHARGVVHRDLKPGNLWITREGRVKILDFGLARQLPAPAPPLDSAAPTAVSPEPRTEPGRVLGTVGYMSPEQVRGEPVDGRSDLFSLGVVLLEMATGRRVFDRGTAGDTLAAVLRDDPLESAGQSLQPSLRRVVARCLEKEPGRRFQSAADLAFALESLLDDGGAHPGAVAGAPRPKGVHPAYAALLAAVSLLAGAGAAWLWPRDAAPAAAVAVRFASYSGRDTAPAVSPDGRTLAFTSDRDGRPRIWLKQLNGGGERALTAGPDDFARFSPDGGSVLFIRSEPDRSSVQRMSLLESEPRKVVDDAEQADWSPDGRQIAFVRLLGNQERLASALLVIDVAGGVERELARFEGDLVGFPRWSPDGRRVIVNTPPFITSGVRRKLILVDAGAGTVAELRLPAAQGVVSAAAWDSPDHVVFLQAESVAGGGTAVTSARAYRQEVGSSRYRPLFWAAYGGTSVDLLPGGRVVFDAMSGRQNLREYALDGSTPPRWLTNATVTDRQPVFAPDGESIVFSSNRSGNLDLWMISTRSGVVRRITEDPADDWDPAFSPDGRSLLWSSSRGGHLEIWAASVDGTGAHQVTHDGEDAQNPTQTRDGRWIVYSSGNRAHPGLWMVRADGSGARQLVQGAVQLPEVSPDGLYATYLVTARTSSTLHVVRLEDAKDSVFAILPPPRRKTSVFPGRARWMADGRRILFTGQDEGGLDGVFAQEFAFGRDTAATRRPLVGFDADWSTESLGLSPDGKRLVLSQTERVFSLMIAEGVRGLAGRPSDPAYRAP